MFIEDLINNLSSFIENKMDEKILIYIQEYLLKSGIFTHVSSVIALLILSMVFLLILFLLISVLFSLDLVMAILLSVLIPIVLFVLFIFIKSERRREEVESSIPDFLRQLSSMLRVGMSLENALVDLSEHGSGPLYDELKRLVVELRMGKSFDESFNNMAKRLDSKDLERSFKIILNAHKSGGGLADVIGDVSDDLRAMLILKRERKSSVMMSIMFLVLASVIAAPFALGMVGVYSSFMIELDRSSAICQVAPLAAEIYLIIHSILAGFLIALIMYGDARKGVKFSIPITVSAFCIFYLISNFGMSFFGFGWLWWYNCGVLTMFLKNFKKLFAEEDGQGSVELILIIGGIIVIVLVCMFVYKSYVNDLGKELESGELNSLNKSFEDISAKFE